MSVTFVYLLFSIKRCVFILGIIADCFSINKLAITIYGIAKWNWPFNVDQSTVTYTCVFETSVIKYAVHTFLEFFRSATDKL